MWSLAYCINLHWLTYEWHCQEEIRASSDWHSVNQNREPHTGEPSSLSKLPLSIKIRRRHHRHEIKRPQLYLCECAFTNLFYSQFHWGRLQRSAAHAELARKGRNSSHCWCRCCGCGRTCPSAWKNVTGSTWVWWQRHWWKKCHHPPWSCGFYSLPVENLEGEVMWSVLYSYSEILLNTRKYCFSLVFT